MIHDLRHIPTRNNRAYCGASVLEYHIAKPGLPVSQRVACAQCLVLANAARAKAHGWKVEVSK